MLAALALLGLLARGQQLQGQLEQLEATAQAEDEPLPADSWAKHLAGNLENYLDVQRLDPEVEQQVRALSDDTLRKSLRIDRQFEDGELDCYQHLTAIKSLIEGHVRQAGELLDPEQVQDYLAMTCPTGRRGCLAYSVRGVELVELLERWRAQRRPMPRQG